MARSTIYDKRWRDAVRPGAIASARALVPVLMEMFEPESVVDVGCGEGWFCREWALAGVPSVIGVDGDYVDVRIARDDHQPPLWDFIPGDLAAPFDRAIFSGGFGVAMSLEVAEHLPAPRAESFIGDLCHLAPIVVFSAALPAQGGEGHVNEQWPSYWRDLFAQHGYVGTGALRWRIWEKEDIGWWYRQNLLVFAADEDLLPAPVDGCPSVVHPGAWAHHRRLR